MVLTILVMILTPSLVSSIGKTVPTNAGITKPALTGVGAQLAISATKPALTGVGAQLAISAI